MFAVVIKYFNNLVNSVFTSSPAFAISNINSTHSHPPFNDYLNEYEHPKNLLLPVLTSNFKCEEAWITPTIVDDFFERISDKVNNKITVLPTIRFDEENYSSFALARNAGWYQRARNYIEHAQLILWPLIANNHWHLMIIGKINHLVHVSLLDGFNHQKDVCQRYIQPFVGHLFPDLSADNIIYELIKIPQQENDYDCGPVICYWGQIIIEHTLKFGYPPDFSEQPRLDYTKFRQIIAKQLCRTV